VSKEGGVACGHCNSLAVSVCNQQSLHAYEASCGAWLSECCGVPPVSHSVIANIYRRWLTVEQAQAKLWCPDTHVTAPGWLAVHTGTCPARPCCCCRWHRSRSPGVLGLWRRAGRCRVTGGGPVESPHPRCSNRPTAAPHTPGPLQHRSIDPCEVAGGVLKKGCDMACWQDTVLHDWKPVTQAFWVCVPRAIVAEVNSTRRSPCSGVNSGTTCASLLRLHGIMTDESTYERGRKRVPPSCPCVIQHAQVWHAGRGHCLILLSTNCCRPQHVSLSNTTRGATQTQTHQSSPRTGRDQSKHGQRDQDGALVSGS
jgi:hypothetical protein